MYVSVCVSFGGTLFCVMFDFYFWFCLSFSFFLSFWCLGGQGRLNVMFRGVCIHALSFLTSLKYFPSGFFLII